jgi:hypothetical protein
LGVAQEAFRPDGRRYLQFGEKIAILYESNTAFGNRTMSAYREEERAVFFPFPLHISEVRGAYEQTTGPMKGDSLRLPNFGSKLRLSLNADSNPRDTEPSLDSAMTAVTSERILGLMLSTIARERFHYVLIVASDVKDTLFLASLVRRQCPDCRLLLSGSDLLFSHPDFSPDLRGSLVASTYPFYLRNQSWSPPFQGKATRSVFPGQPEQGYYNATIALLNPADATHLLEYGPPFPALYTEPPSEHPEVRQMPPVWISVIGEGGLYPVAVFPADKDPYAAHVFAPPTPQTGRAEFIPLHPTPWLIPVIGMMLLLGYTGFAYRYVLRRRSRWGRSDPKRGSWEMRNLLWPPRAVCPYSDRLRRGQQFYAGVCLVSVAAVYGYLAFVWLIPLGHWLVHRDSSPVVFQPSWGWWIMPVLLLALPVVLVVEVARSRGWRDRAAAFWRVAWQAVSGGLALLRERPAPAPPPAEQANAGGPAAPPAAPAAAADTGAPDTPPRPSLGRLVVRGRFLLLSLFLLVILATYLVKQRRSAHLADPGAILFFFERATSLASGVSPVVPVLFLGLAFFLWAYFQLKRLYLLGPRPVDSPFPPAQRLAAVNRWHRRVEDDLRVPSRALDSTGVCVAWLALFFTFCRLASRFVPSVDGVVTESIFLLALAVLTLLVFYGVLHVRKVWQSTRKLLHAIASLPLEESFKRIPTTITASFGPYLSSERPGRRDHLPYRREQQRILAEGYDRARVRLCELYTDLCPAHVAQTAAFPATLPEPSADSLTATARDCLAILERVWHCPCLSRRLLKPGARRAAEASDTAATVHIDKKVRAEGGGDGPTTQISETVATEAPGDADQELRDWLARAQDFVTVEVVAYLGQFFAQLRNLALFTAIAVLLILLAVTSYPLQPQRLWLLLVTVMAGTVTVAVIWSVVQMERDELVSRILRTTPNRLNFHWAFLSQVLLFATPVLGVLVAVSSDASNMIHALLDPVVQLLR